MKNAIAVLGLLGAGFGLGELFDGLAEQAAADGVPLPPCQDIDGDGSSDVADAVFFLRWRFLGGPAPSCPGGNDGAVGLPDTGQVTCYDPRGAVVACTDEVHGGQDGFYRTGCSNRDRFVARGDGTVTDTCTELMWEQETPDLDGDGRFTREDLVSWEEALAYCNTLELGGHDDWRLPNIRELQSIADYGRHNARDPVPAIDPVFSSMPGFYWSSTSMAAIRSFAWVVRFDSGSVSALSKNSEFLVRAVRGGM